MMGSENSMLFGGVFMWIFWFVVIAIIVLVVRSMVGSGEAGSSKQESAMDILNKRFANGEIDEVEYKSRKSELER